MTYRERLISVIRELHGCEATYVETVPLVEVFRGKVIWHGNVEVFDLSGHPKASRGYAWGFRRWGRWRITAVLNLPPVKDPSSAVRVAIAASAAP